MRIFAFMKNIVFDLGGVLFMRDPKKCTPAFIDFFRFVRQPELPRFWNEYDRGTLTIDQVTDELCRLNGCERSLCEEHMRTAIDRQEPVKPTERLIGELKAAGYRLYVLSNMSREFIAFLRRFPVYRQFDGEVVSCEEGLCKPEPAIYRLLLDRYGLDPAETLFIDDRADNIAGARGAGIHGFLFDRRDPEAACAELRRRLL